MAYRLVGRLNVSALEKSLTEVFRRHEALRTTFPLQDDEPIQFVNSIEAAKLTQINFTHIAAKDKSEKIRQFVRSAVVKPFVLETGPLFQMMLIAVHDDEYILLANMHHIISDGWSLGILFSEITHFYRAFDLGIQPTLPDLPLQYLDYSIWQRNWLTGKILENQLQYWSDKLKSAPNFELPTDHPRPATFTYDGDTFSVDFSLELSSALRTLSRGQNISLFMVLLTGFEVLLYRYTGQDDLLVGTFSANRTRTEIENVIGFFINTVVLRTDLPGAPTFREALERVSSVALEAFAHQDVPFEKIVQEFHPDRDPSRSPFFQVSFLLQNFPGSPFELSGLEVYPYHIESSLTKYDLSFIMWEKPDGCLQLAINYNTNLFNADTIARLAQNFQTLLANALTDIEQNIADISILTPTDYHRMISEWNAAKVPWPPDMTILTLFEAQANKTPAEIAIVFQDQTITYQDLNARANRVAAFLLAQGASPETRVAVALNRSIDAIITFLGIMKSGAAFVPLDITFPPDRLAFIIADSGAMGVIVHDEIRSQLPELDIPLYPLESMLQTVEISAEYYPIQDRNPDYLAYIMYTSGSTGQPKGVLVTHKNIIGFLWGYKQVNQDGSWRVGTTVAPFSFDTSIDEIYSTLCFGGTLHIILPEESADPEYFARYLIDHAITTSYVVPDFLEDIADHLRSSTDQLQLECLITGLAPKKERVLQCCRDLSPDLRILNAYGPTEVTYGATAYVFDGVQDPENEVPIGVPFPNYEVYIVDQNLQPVPIGVVGELLIGGVGVARGYDKQPALTAEKFIPDPFSDRPGSRLYCTGDLTRYLPDGNIEFLGRSDNQVKVRGYRIELGEIESVLLQNPVVNRAVVVVNEPEPGDKRLVAYVQPASKKSPNPKSLRESAEAKLPGYMVPNYFMVLDEFPLMSNGKVNRQTLPPPEFSRDLLAAAYQPPDTPEEKIVATVWRDVLNIEKIGIHDNFFALGGHSLLATQVVSRLRKAAQVELPLKLFFENPTIAKLSRVIISTPQKIQDSTRVITSVQRERYRRPKSQQK